MTRSHARIPRRASALLGLAAVAAFATVACGDDVTDNPPGDGTLLQDGDTVLPGEENTPVNAPDGSQVTPTIVNPPPGGDPNQDQGSGED